MTKTEYTRKISTEEAKQNRILITKKALKLFPPVNQKFRLIYGMTHVEAQLVAENQMDEKKKKSQQVHYLKIPDEIPIMVNEKITITKITEENYEIKKKPI
ncbi:MAG: hypothetical protein ACXQS8_03845 [Candidatus Helarchaeales archaeon]